MQNIVNGVLNFSGNNVVKEKKFYAIGEQVWYKTLKCVARVVSIDTHARRITIVCNPQTGRHIHTDIWNVTKLRSDLLTNMDDARRTLGMPRR